MIEDTIPRLRTTCARCQTEASGSAWCPACGLNLRVGAPLDPLPTTVAAAAAPPPARRRRGLLAAIAAAAVVAGAVVLAAIVLDGGEPRRAETTGSATRPASTPPAPPPVSTAPSVPAAPLVTPNDIAGVLVRYENAYSDEDVDALRGLFTEDLVRQSAGDAPQGLDGALATYAAQFAQLGDATYTLDDVRFLPGRGEGAATGTYAISGDPGTVTGQIEFHLVARDGELLIDRLTIAPA